MHGFSGFCAPDAMCTKTRGLRGAKNIENFRKTEYNQLLKGRFFADGGYAMGKKSVNDIGIDEEELIEGLERQMEEDFENGFFDEDEDDFFDDGLLYDLFPFVASVYDMPIINHTKGFTDENFGYAQGITQDGIPFAAEVYDVDELECLVLYIPAFFSFAEDKDAVYDEANRISELTKQKKKEIDVLDIGMLDAGDENDKNIVGRYLDYVVSTCLVTFTTEECNGSVSYRIDTDDNELAKITIPLVDADGFYGMTDIDMKQFYAGDKTLKRAAKMFNMEDYR